MAVSLGKICGETRPGGGQFGINNFRLWRGGGGGNKKIKKLRGHNHSAHCQDSHPHNFYVYKGFFTGFMGLRDMAPN